LRTAANLPGVRSLKNFVGKQLWNPQADYERWIARRVRQRRGTGLPQSVPNLLSFLTTVWDTPVEYLRVLGRSVLEQEGEQSFEWVLLDNGCSRSDVRACLDELAKDPRVVLIRSEDNLGIVGGMRRCLERASGRYVLPIDSDDRLYPDAVLIMAAAIVEGDYPAALYSDEDQLRDRRVFLPFFKPDWDPVLFVDSCYIAHLCAFDRQMAIELDVYGADAQEGCHDWDTYTRFVHAGHAPVHVPEVLYSWRQHEASTAGGNVKAKAFVYESQRRVVQRFVDQQPKAQLYSVQPSPLFNGTPDWWIQRKPAQPEPLSVIRFGDRALPHAKQQDLELRDYPLVSSDILDLNTTVAHLESVVGSQGPQSQLILLVSQDVTMCRPEWIWDVVMLTEIFPDTVGVAGLVRDAQGKTVDGERILGFGSGWECPDVGRTSWDPGYFARAFKHHTTSAASLQLAVFRRSFLVDALRSCPAEAPLGLIGAWLGVVAQQSHKRIVYSPIVEGKTDHPWEIETTAADWRNFVERNQQFIPDRGNYPSVFSRSRGRAFTLKGE